VRVPHYHVTSSSIQTPPHALYLLPSTRPSELTSLPPPITAIASAATCPPLTSLVHLSPSRCHVSPLISQNLYSTPTPCPLHHYSFTPDPSLPSTSMSSPFTTSPLHLYTSASHILAPMPPSHRSVYHIIPHGLDHSLYPLSLCQSPRPLTIVFLHISLASSLYKGPTKHRWKKSRVKLACFPGIELTHAHPDPDEYS
jgi:hypothetical protein